MGITLLYNSRRVHQHSAQTATTETTNERRNESRASPNERRTRSNERRNENQSRANGRELQSRIKTWLCLCLVLFHEIVKTEQEETRSNNRYIRLAEYRNSWKSQRIIEKIGGKVEEEIKGIKSVF